MSADDPSLADGPSFEIVNESTIVERGHSGYDIFRIPVQVRAPNGDLLLFCEARGDGSDTGDIDLFLFRSTDEGKNWDDGTLLVDNASDTAADIAAVVNEGRVHLLYQERPGGQDFSEYLGGDASEASGYHIYSDDSGETWSGPTEITDQVLPASDEQLPMFGPNNGIVLDSGRLVVPMYYADQSADNWTPSVIYSDDGGQTWQRSEDAFPGEGVNETAVVQTPNHDVYAIARDNSGDDNDQKRFFRSTDRGETWTETGDVDAFIPEVSNQQSMVTRGERIFLATPEAKDRDNGRLKTGIYDPSQSDNVNWNDQDFQITPGGFAYSTMVIHDSTIHLVYEENTQNTSSGYESLKYVQIRVSLPDLSIQEGSPSRLGFSPDLWPGTDNNPVGMFSLSSDQAGAACDSAAITNGTPGVEGISAARLFWSSDRSLDVGSDTKLDEKTTDASSSQAHPH